MAAIPTFVERRIRIESVDEKGRRNGQPSYEVTYVFDDEKAKFVRRDVEVSKRSESTWMNALNENRIRICNRDANLHRRLFRNPMWGLVRNRRIVRNHRMCPHERFFSVCLHPLITHHKQTQPRLHIIRTLRLLVLLNRVSHNPPTPHVRTTLQPALLKLRQILQCLNVRVIVQVRAPLERPIELICQLGKQLFIITLLLTHRSHAGVIRHHETRHTVRALQIRTRLRQSHLDARRTPRHELMQILLSDALQALVDLHRIDQSLNNVHDGNVTPGAGIDTHHQILVLEKATHHIIDGRLSHRGSLCITQRDEHHGIIDGEGCIRSHEEVQPRLRNQ